MTANAIEKVCAELGLPKGDAFTQDVIYELPEIYRTTLWLEKYADAYAKPGRSAVEKNLLMALMLDVANDLVAQADAESDRVVERVLDFLAAHRDQHEHLIDYWALTGEAPEDCFALTERIRRLQSVLKER
ncbi:hypothetical protein [Corticimicrobacter populi]|uniref:hypothetical protein n=1 Tax=Corticimicrobacter populi TaxID=2175229 RepID=UPI00195A700B|nr:hypothetical protein [Corticimicrobacter populi]